MSTEAERKTLGDFLRGTRQACGMTFADVEKATAGHATAPYVRELEAGEVAMPAPHILYALAGAYIVSYEKLMELAGHLHRSRDL